MDIDKIISEFKAIDFNEKSDIKIRELFREVGDIAYMAHDLEKGRIIMRARPSEPNTIFNKRSDYSFKPQSHNKTYQRASTPGQTRFYGCVVPEIVLPGELENARITGLLETMPWLTDKSKSGYAKISYGRWEVEEDLTLLAVVHHRQFYSKNNFTRSLVQGYEKFLDSHKNEIAVRSQMFTEFLADEYAKPVNNHFEYMISAIFSEIATNYSKRDIDGILYPSVKVSGDGYNVALTPKACEKISLRAAGECSVYSKKDYTYVGTDSIVSLDGKTDNFELVETNKDKNEILKKLGIKSIDELI